MYSQHFNALAVHISLFYLLSGCVTGNFSCADLPLVLPFSPHLTFHWISCIFRRVSKSSIKSFLILICSTTKSQAFLRKRFSYFTKPFFTNSTTGKSSAGKSYYRKNSKMLDNKKVITAIEAHFWQIQERASIGWLDKAQ
jgi:hypothetical protein